MQDREAGRRIETETASPVALTINGIVVLFLPPKFHHHPFPGPKKATIVSLAEHNSNKTFGKHFALPFSCNRTLLLYCKNLYPHLHSHLIPRNCSRSHSCKIHTSRYIIYQERKKKEHSSEKHSHQHHNFKTTTKTNGTNLALVYAHHKRKR